ncbi:uncharacterized protein LOC115455775 [Manduca sexta]|uniref:uncharacterized protein LOC115455775 n=1 Tax=Manduca sexta TaxID=7130 RepID=UPI001184592F|nr:uncharacterized protein LOC115455775 [Manduca sexta]
MHRYQVENMVQLTLADISKYLTVAVLDKAFKLRTNSQDVIRFFQITRAAPAGEGLIGAVYRIRVSGEQHTASFIAKGFAGDVLLKKSLDCTKYFERETRFFSKILPVLVELQASLGAKHTIQNNIPICYGCHNDGENDYLLLEDLAESDCKSISENPTEFERDITLGSLAHLHAVSFALRIKKPDVFARFASSIPELYYTAENRQWYQRFLQNAVKLDLDVLRQYEDDSSIYLQKFKKLVDDDIYEKVIEICSTPGCFPVLSHGDAWCPNFLCSKDRAVMIDFQLFRCASPATDVTLFLILCSNVCRDKEDFFKAIDVYYNSVTYYLKDMGINPATVITRQDLNEELRKFGKFGLFGSITSIPLLASKRCDVLESFEEKFADLERIPLEELWVLTQIDDEDHKMRLVNAVRVSVDTGLI